MTNNDPADAVREALRAFGRWLLCLLLAIATMLVVFLSAQP